MVTEDGTEHKDVLYPLQVWDDLRSSIDKRLQRLPGTTDSDESRHFIKRATTSGRDQERVRVPLCPLGDLLSTGPRVGKT